MVTVSNSEVKISVHTLISLFNCKVMYKAFDLIMGVRGQGVEKIHAHHTFQTICVKARKLCFILSLPSFFTSSLC